MTEEKSELARQAVRSIWDRVATADWARFEKENPERAAVIVIAHTYPVATHKR